MVFHDMLPVFRKMSLEAVGRFVLAMGDYSECRTIPDFSDDIRADTLWDNVRPRMDDNFMNYEADRLSRAYAGWCSSLKDAGLEYLKLPFDDWKIARSEYERYRARLDPSETPSLFNDWVQKQKERAELMDSASIQLPWDSDHDQNGL